VLRLAYTLTTAWDTLPLLLTRLNQTYPQLEVDAREVFGSDISDLLLSEEYDLAIAPMTSYAPGLHSRVVRREPLRIAVSEQDPLAKRDSVALRELRDLRFELWPREMSPGFYDAVLGACRVAGFEPSIDEHAAGNTVWGYLAHGRGVALINASLAEQLPRGVALVKTTKATPTLTFAAVWHRGDLATVDRALEVVAALGAERHWLPAEPDPRRRQVREPAH
jgi:DNA-binding transcriptional LysR family regulator